MKSCGREQSGRNLRCYLGIFLECLREIAESQSRQTVSRLKLESWTSRIRSKIAKHLAAILVNLGVIFAIIAVALFRLNYSCIFLNHRLFPLKVSVCLVNYVLSLCDVRKSHGPQFGIINGRKLNNTVII
jgi:hypothetical protein